MHRPDLTRFSLCGLHSTKGLDQAAESVVPTRRREIPGVVISEMALSEGLDAEIAVAAKVERSLGKKRTLSGTRVLGLLGDLPVTDLIRLQEGFARSGLKMYDGLSHDGHGKVTNCHAIAKIGYGFTAKQMGDCLQRRCGPMHS